MILLIDVSSTVHADYATQGDKAAELSLRRISDFVDRYAPSEVRAAAECPSQWRSGLLPSYKAERPPKDDELLRQIRLFKEGFTWGPIEAAHNQEADDVIATQCYLYSDEQIVIFSRDKDMRQLLREGKVIILRKYNLKPFGSQWSPPHGDLRVPQWFSTKDLASEELGWGVEPEQCVDFQAVVGDKADGVPGADGIGPKTIGPLLNRYKTIENILSYAHLTPKKKAALQAIMPNLDTVRKVLTLNHQCALRLDKELVPF